MREGEDVAGPLTQNGSAHERESTHDEPADPVGVTKRARYNPLLVLLLLFLLLLLTPIIPRSCHSTSTLSSSCSAFPHPPLHRSSLRPFLLEIGRVAHDGSWGSAAEAAALRPQVLNI